MADAVPAAAGLTTSVAGVVRESREPCGADGPHGGVGSSLPVSGAAT